MIVLISGKQGSGKTTLTQHIHDKYVCQTIKFADPVYDCHNAVWEVLSAYGVPRERKSGDLLQYIGTDFGRKRDENIWVNIARRRADRIVAGNMPVILDDCRFRNELAAFPDAYKIRLVCDRDLRKARCDSWRDTEFHASETDLDGTEDQFDLVIDTGVTSLEKMLVIVDAKLHERFPTTLWARQITA